MSEEDRFVRFSEKEIKDNDTGFIIKVCSDALLNKMNELEHFRKHHKSERDKLAKENELLWDAVQGFLALEGLRSLGYL